MDTGGKTISKCKWLTCMYNEVLRLLTHWYTHKYAYICFSQIHFNNQYFSCNVSIGARYRAATVATTAGEVDDSFSYNNTMHLCRHDRILQRESDVTFGGRTDVRYHAPLHRYHAHTTEDSAQRPARSVCRPGEQLLSQQRHLAVPDTESEPLTSP